MEHPEKLKKIGKFLLGFLSFSFCFHTSFAQQMFVVKPATEAELNKISLPRPQPTIRKEKLLTLNEAIILALRNNPTVENSRFQRISDKYALELANYAFEPQFDFSGNVTFTKGEKTGYNFNPGISLNTRAGTQLKLNNTTNLQGNQQEEFTVTQPLLRGFGKVNQFPWLDAQDTELVARQTFKNSIMQMVTQVINNYRQVVQDDNNLKVQQKALTRAEQTAEQYKLQINAGKMAASELLQEQTNLASTRLDFVRQKNSAEQNYQTLLDTLGLAPESKLKVDTNIHFEIYHPPSKDQAVALALNHNPQYVSQKVQLNSAERAVLSAKDNLRWQLDLSGSLTFASSPGSTSIAEGFQSLSPQSDPTAIISLSIPIRDISSKAALVNAKISLIQAQESLEQARRTLIRQVVNSLSDLNNQSEQLDIAKQGISLQRKNLEAEQIKQKYGQSTALNVNLIQDNLLQQEIDYVNSQISYLNSVTNFENLLGTTLDKWNIKMRY